MEGPQPVPAAVYLLRILEATDKNKDGLPLTSKKGNPMVKCKLEIADGEYAGRVIFHWVTFIEPGNPGDGMAIHFLKHIGEEWEGDFIVEPENWIDKTFRAFVKVEKDNEGKPRNSVGWLADEKEKDKVSDEVPF